jgi:GT2 family glycosyltransferase
MGPERADRLEMPDPNSPGVTVVVPTHNRPRLLGRTLASLADQTFGDFEVVVVNDGGVDVADVVAAYSGPAIRLIDHDMNKGRCAACNTGIAAAEGTYVCFLADDDRYYPHHLATAVGAIEKLGPGHGVYTHAVQILENDQGDVLERKITGAQDFSIELLAVTNYICAMTILAPTAAVREAGSFDTAIDVLEDWELWLRLTHQIEWHHIDVPTAEYRMREGHANSTTREFFRFHPALEYVYAKHPLPAGSALQAHRDQMLAGSAGRAEAFGYDATIAVAGSDDIDEAVASARSVVDALTETTYEVLFLVPDARGWEQVADAFDGDVQVYAVGPGGVRAAWDHVSRRRAGRHTLLLRAGEVAEKTLVMQALGSPSANAVRVGKPAVAARSI